MDIERYQELCKRTCGTSTHLDTLAMTGLGLAGESGEVADHLKKALFHGHMLDREHIKKELGDILWYIATLCNTLEISLNEVLEGNIEKLRRRYPDGFSSDRSINRDNA